MTSLISNNPWWLKSLIGEGIGVVGTYAREEIRYSYRNKKPRPNLEDELNKVRENLNDTKCLFAKYKAIKQQKEDQLNEVPKPQPIRGILRQPKIEYSFLFDQWIWEGGVTLLFSPTKLGKTTCAVQIANDIASGSPSKMLPDVRNQHNHAPQTVLYYDLESDETDFHDRYGMASDGLSPNLKIIYDCIFDTSEFLMDSIARTISYVDDNVTVVIDNISMIGDSKLPAKTEQLMKRIKSLQSQFKQTGHLLTFILVAHTVKATDDKIDLEDISGSSNFANLSSSILTMEKCGLGNDYRILKLLRTRKDAGIEDGLVIVVKRSADPYLHFEYVDTMYEDDALKGVEYSPEKASSQDSKPGSKRGRKPAKYSELSDDEILKLKEMVDAIGKNIPFGGTIYPTKASIAKHFDIPDTYVDRMVKKADKIQSQP